MNSILVVEDEVKLSQSLCEFLIHEKYKPHAIYDGALVVDWVKENKPDLILLDIMLPNRDGVELCRDIRSFSNVPIIMVTARTDEVSRVMGLDVGADDYVCKPYGLMEVSARIRAILRRQYQQSPTDDGLVINTANQKASFASNEVALTVVEFNIIETLKSQPGKIYSRDQLMQTVYTDQRVVSDRTIDSHIKKLRKKLAEIAPDIDFLHSVYGAGYKYEV